MTIGELCNITDWEKKITVGAPLSDCQPLDIATPLFTVKICQYQGLEFWDWARPSNPYPSGQ